MYWAVVLAGGSGTRLWPISCEEMPKQALTLVGERSMFQHAADRLLPLSPSNAANLDQAFACMPAGSTSGLRPNSTLYSKL
jgi:molybdopterin-guanine dinucleotide biosynthesis protein A